jgi:sugar lactone lactonase YvrE
MPPIGTEAQAQAVPDALAVGPDGALYVGELGGMPYAVGASRIYRIVPGHKPTVYARHLTAVGDIAFDRRGRLLVLELDRQGLAEPGFINGDPTSGDIIRINRDGTRSTLLSTGLVYPTAIAVAPSGTIYVCNDGASSANVGDGGEILKIIPPAR